jgi:sensor histidine kinase regulating citrate/malate metabolism
VLASKARSCAEANITLDAQVALPAEMPIDDIELASVFFNLIDNALHECVALAQEEDAPKPTITVRANTLAGQVFVEVSNPCRSGAEGKMREAGKSVDSTRTHGWGVDIVQNVAKKYHGIASFAENNGVFTAQVMLPLSSPEQADGSGASQ